MKQNSFLTLQHTSRGLIRTKEYWQSESYKEHNQSVVESFKAVRNMAPNKNMHYIREMVFAVDASVDLNKLLKTAAVIRTFFTIDCFQISIDRKRGLAHMLFDFMNKETMTIVEINQSSFMNLQVMIIKELGIPVPDEFRDQWSYFSLRSAMMYDKNVFQNLLQECSHLNMSKHYYQVIKDLVNFADERIGRIIKKLNKVK